MDYFNEFTELELLVSKLDFLEQTINGQPDPGPAFASSYLSNLEKLYETLCKKHVRLTALKSSLDTNVTSPDLYDPKTLQTIQAKYFAIKTKLLQVPANLLRHSSQSSLASVAPTLSHIQLPKITLPKFNGDSKKWINFRTLFNSLIASKENLSNEEKLHYLQSCLSGEALIMSSNNSLESPDLDEIWSNLKKRYDNKLDLVSMALKQILNSENRHQGHLMCRFETHFIGN